MANGFQHSSGVTVLNGAKANGSLLYGVGSLRKPLPLSIFGEEEEEEAPEEEVVGDEADARKEEQEEFGLFESAPAPVENGSKSISADELGFGDFTGPAAAAEVPEDLGHFSPAPTQPGNDVFGNFPTPSTNGWFGESRQPQNSSSNWVSAAPTSTLMLAMHGIHGTLKPSAGRSDNKSSLPAPTNVVSAKVVALPAPTNVVNSKVVALPAPTNLVDAKVVAAEDPDDWGDFVEPEMGTAVASPALLALPAPPSKDRVKANGSHFQMLDLISLDAGPAPPLMLDLHSSSPAETATKGGDLLLLSWDDDPLPPTEIPVSAIEVNGQTAKKTDVDLLEDGERMETIVGVGGVTTARVSAIEVNGQTGKKTDVEDLVVAWDDGHQPMETIAGVEGITAAPVSAIEVNGQTGKKTDVEDLLVAWGDGQPVEGMVGVEGVFAAPVAAVEINGQTGKKTDVEDLLVAWDDGEPIVGMEGVTAAAVEVGQTGKKMDVEDLLVAWDDGEPVEPIVGMEGVTAAEEEAGTMITDPEGLKGPPPAGYPRSTSLPGASFPDFMASLYPEPEEKSNTIVRSQSSGNLTGECESRATQRLSRDLFEDQIKDQTSGNLVAILEDKTSELLPSDLFKDEGTVNHRTTDKFSSTTLNHDSSMIDFFDFEGPLPSDSSINAISYVDMLAELKVQTMDDDLVLAKRQQIQSRYVRAWNSLASACTAELNHALEIWRDAIRARCRNQILATEQGTRYYLAVAEVYKVAKIIEASAGVYIEWLDAAPELKSSLQTALVQCEEAWASLHSTVEPAAAQAVKNLQDALVSLVESSPPVGDPETSQGHCCLSLLPFHSVPGVAVAQWSGRHCLLPVANFWANRVLCDPPFATSCE